MIKKSTIDNNIKEWRRSVKKFYENKNFPGYSSSFHKHCIHETSRELIHNCNNIVTLSHWFIETDKQGHQYVSGYLANGCYWVSSSIQNITFSYDEHNLDHLRVNTRNTTYCLAYTDGAFSTSYIDIKKPSQKRDHEKFFDMRSSIFLTNWEIVDKGYGYNYRYHIRGKTNNRDLSNPIVDSAEIDTLVIKYDKFDEGNYEDPLLLIKTTNDFTFMVFPKDTKYINEYMRIS